MESLVHKQNKLIIDLKLYELASKSYSLFSNGMHKHMKSYDDIQLEIDIWQCACWSYGALYVLVNQFLLL